jgi:anti-anti-sigma factor
VLEISPLVDGAGLKLAGELDVVTVPRLAEALFEASTGELGLDLSRLTFLDSSGLHAILALARSRDGSGSVVLLDPSPAVMRVLEIVGIEHNPAVEIRSSEAEPAAA